MALEVRLPQSGKIMLSKILLTVLYTRKTILIKVKDTPKVMSLRKKMYYNESFAWDL